MLTVASKYPSQSKYFNKKETKQKERPTMRGVDQVLWRLTILNGGLHTPLVSHCLSSHCGEITLAVGAHFSGCCRC